MDWAEVSFQTSHAAMEAVSEVLQSFGAGGTVVEDPALINRYIDSGAWDYTDIPKVLGEAAEVVTVKAYFPLDAHWEDVLHRLGEALENLKAACDTMPAKFSWQAVKDEDWSENWKKYFHTEKIGDRVVIKPTWEEYVAKDDEVVVELDPGAAFGTGSHATTSMCIRFLEELDVRGKRVFDVGCGSGILAITAAKLGAREVIAKDYDRTAVRIAAENVAQNHVGDVVTTGETDLWSAFDGKAEVLTANLIADLVIRLMPELDAHMAEGGRLIASGIIEERFADVKKAVTEHGFRIADMRLEKEWVALLIAREGEV